MPCNCNLRALAAQRQGGHPRRRRHADGVQHHLRLRRHHDGHRGDARLARLARGDRRLDRAGRARPPVRRPRVLVGCDKTIPAAAMALARLDIPGLVLYGGSIAPGRFRGRDVTIQDVFEAVGAHAAGTMTDAELRDARERACPGAGACGGQFTANTMAMALEFLGHRAAGQSDVPADGPGKAQARRGCRRAGDGARARRHRAPSQILTRDGVRERDRRASRRPAARPTPCCTCWRSRARRASR